MNTTHEDLRFHRGHPRILMYHAVEEVDEDPNRISVTPRRFASQMEHLRRRRLRGVSVAELVAAAERGDDRGLVGLTFDDGFDNFIDHALPVLRRRGFTATVFPVVGLLGGGNEWDAGGPEFRIVDEEQLRTIVASGMEVGSHSLSHPRLSRLPAAEVRREVEDSRSRLEAVVGREVAGFCYPYGDHDPQVVGAVQDAGYAYACAYHTHGVWSRFTLPRANVGQSEGAIRLEAKLQLTDPLERIRRWRAGGGEAGAVTVGSGS